MNLKQIITVATISAFGMSANTALADAKGEAYSACKNHVSELHEGQANIKLKKIRKRDGNLEVNLRVSASGERYQAQCIVARDGTLNYTDGNRVVAKN
ncbi:MAG: hypothetical protein ACI9FB_001231 [Candidatus Azotimanducaceae bacterium]|jgi:hypothetical protein